MVIITRLKPISTCQVKNSINAVIKSNQIGAMWILQSHASQMRSASTFKSDQIKNDLNESVNNLKRFRLFNRKPYYYSEYHSLNTVYSPAGEIGAMPTWYKFGFFKIFLTIVVFIMLGASISKKAVTILEENDIFKPEDDDDDDDDD